MDKHGKYSVFSSNDKKTKALIDNFAIELRIGATEICILYLNI